MRIKLVNEMRATGEKQKPAAEKDGGKEAVFKFSQAVAQHADEPSEGYACKMAPCSAPEQPCSNWS